MSNCFKGPLGSHINYITNIALPNFVDYERLKKRNAENNKPRKTPVLYEEFRHFINAVESFNNILDYYYYEFEDVLTHHNVKTFRKAMREKYLELKAVSNLANAYKHCVREVNGKKKADLPWAKDLQKPMIKIDISFPQRKVDVAYKFEWPIPENEEILKNAWSFWIRYVNDPDATKLFIGV